MGLLQNPAGGATSALQLIIANNEGTLATAAGVAAVVNNQGTLATSANQVANNTLLGIIMNTQGTQATAAGVATVANSQGTLATSANQVVANTTLSTIANGEGTLSKLLATVINTEGPTGTNATSALNCEISFSDHAAIDAFGRLRVSTPDYRMDAHMSYSVSSDVWDMAFNSTGTTTFDSTNRQASVTCAANGTSVLQSHKYSTYTPGRSHLIFTTFILGSTPPFAVTRRVGYFDGSNGIYLEQTNTAVNLVLASTTSNGNQTVAQSAWNIDKLNGTGPSGITLDLSKVQILVISLQALYAGRVLIAFDIDGVVHPVHQFTHANKITSPYIPMASLPVRYEVASTGSNTGSLNAICASVISEGGGALSEIPSRTFGAGLSSATSVNARRPVLSVQPKKFFNSLPNTAMLLPTLISISSASQPVYVELVRNGVLTGPAWTNVDANSMALVDSTASAISGGSTIYAFVVGSGAGATQLVVSANLTERLITAYSQLLDTPDTLSIVVTSSGGASATVAGMSWKEIR